AGKPQPDRNGTYGLRYLLEQRGLPVEEFSLGEDGQPTMTKEGRAKITRTFDAMANLTQEASWGRDGQAFADAEGIAGAQLTYDSYGNLQELAFVGMDRQLVIHRRIGAAVRSFRYDTHGNLVENAFLDLHRQPVTGRIGGTVPAFARQTLEWDEHGRSLETYFG